MNYPINQAKCIMHMLSRRSLPLMTLFDGINWPPAPVASVFFIVAWASSCRSSLNDDGMQDGPLTKNLKIRSVKGLCRIRIQCLKSLWRIFQYDSCVHVRNFFLISCVCYFYTLPKLFQTHINFYNIYLQNSKQWHCEKESVSHFE